MTQLVSNVLMQPRSDAVERPMTLIEKLDEYHQSLYERWYDNHKHPYDEGAMDAVEKAINIVKQHQDESGWIACSERMPEDEQEVLWWNEAYQCLVIGEWRENRELVFYRSGDYADVSEFFYWQCLPKPPSEVQGD